MTRAMAASSRYAAFISYRHVEPDRRWATWLHRALEGYRVPGAARRELSLPLRVGRVFRDEDEVSASSDLNAEIEKALQESQFLIVVCSPRAPASKWVNREIERFRQMGRGDQILALLVEGSPKEAFPPALREIRTIARLGAGEAEVIEEIEPLAADVRPSPARSRHATRMAKLRLIATVLGCRFDDLRRRDQERQQRQAVALAMAALFLALVLGGLALFAFSQRDKKQAALDDYDRLGDLSRLQNLQAEADKLWPCVPALVPEMESWAARGSLLKDRLAGHQAVLARLRSHGREVTPESRDAQPQPSDSRPSPVWQFDDPAEQFKHDTTAKLVADLTAFVDPDRYKGLLAEVRARLAFAASVEHETLVKYKADWKRAIDAISANPKYAVRIKEQIGLIPIGEDPKSHLWEFVHLQTVTPSTEPIPKRGTDGRLVVTEAMGIVFVLLPGGTFRMGAVKEPPDEDTPMNAPNVDPEARQDESPVTDVTLEPFFLSKYEMTQGQWLRLVGVNPSQLGPGWSAAGKTVNLSHPVERVCWDDCDLWLGRMGLCLPTEAQWEYGARGGTTTPRWTGVGTKELVSAANLGDACLRETGGQPDLQYESWNDGYSGHAPIGSFAPNPFGLHDVLGNVWEWVRDHYHYQGYNVIARRGDGLRSPAKRLDRCMRGGSWDDQAVWARSAQRNPVTQGLRAYYLGVRPTRQLDK